MNKIIREFIERSRFFSRNTTPKIISIIFALVMWLYVMGDVNPEMTKDFTNIKVQLLNVEEMKNAGLVMIGQEDYTVNIKIGGRRNDMIHISQQDIVISADIRGFREGVNSVPLEISSPANIKVLDISPKQLKVTLDEIVRRQKPVQIQTLGVPEGGFEPSEAVLSLQEVMVEGPESLVNQVMKVVGEANFGGRVSDFSGRVPLKAVNGEGKTVNGVEVTIKSIGVNIPLYSVKDVKISLELEGKLPKGYRITNTILKPEYITIKGSREAMKMIGEIKTKPINIDSFIESKEKAVELILPEGISVVGKEPTPVVSIEIEEIEEKEFIYRSDEIKIEQLKENFRTSINTLPEGIKVRVMIAKNVTPILTKEDVLLSVNVKDLEEGKHNLGLSAVTAKKVEEIRIIPEIIEIEILQEQETTEP